VRAMMVVRANEMIYNAPSPQLAQMLLELLNHHVTPVVMSPRYARRGDLAQLSNVGQTMSGLARPTSVAAHERRSGTQASRACPAAPLRCR